MTEAEALGLLQSCRNWGRWGADDERGTLNYITPDVVLDALHVVKRGVPVGLGQDLRAAASTSYHMLLPPDATSAADAVTVVPHGFDVTHVDALAHNSFEGGTYGGHDVRDVVTVNGLARNAIDAMSDGIVTRGVFLDVAAARGVRYLEPDDGVSTDDLLAAEGHAEATVRRGDAVFVRIGTSLREADAGPTGDERRPGLLADAVAWLHDRQVAVYSGDCIEKMPSGYQRLRMPLHQVGLVAMGLALLDNPDMERLRSAVHRFASATFLLTVAPLRIRGGTGSAVNPIALF